MSRPPLPSHLPRGTVPADGPEGPQEYSRVVWVSGRPERTLTPDLGSAELRPGQRRPTAWDERESEKDLTRSRFGGFPHGPQYTIDPLHAFHWQTPGFRKQLLEMALEGNEEAELLLLDLACREGLLGRARFEDDPLPFLSEYLKPGRDDWGCYAALIREGLESGDLNALQCPEAAQAVGYRAPLPEDAEAPAHDALEDRDQALRLLGRGGDGGFTVRELIALDCGDAELQDRKALCVAGRWRSLDELPLYALETYLDYRPELPPEAPLFVTKDGGRLSERQVFRIVASRPRRG